MRSQAVRGVGLGAACEVRLEGDGWGGEGLLAVRDGVVEEDLRV